MPEYHTIQNRGGKKKIWGVYTPSPYFFMLQYFQGNISFHHFICPSFEQPDKEK
jgi:hypothetical protein